MPKGALIGVMPGLRYTANEVGWIRVWHSSAIPTASPRPSLSRACILEERLFRVGAANCDQSVEDLLSSVQRELASFSMARRSPMIARLVAVRRPVALWI
jgi:hypothetical protein